MDAHTADISSDTVMMTVREVAQYLRVSQSKIYNLAREGCLPGMRVGKSWRFRRDLIDAWIQQATEATLANPA